MHAAGYVRAAMYMCGACTRVLLLAAAAATALEATPGGCRRRSTKEVSPLVLPAVLPAVAFRL